jgi:hypothetical protein
MGSQMEIFETMVLGGNLSFWIDMEMFKARVLGGKS